ncbi:MAG: hypothetical protein P1V97_03015 [Planctomycetota bacterium]|nr:hypothetical protein [Planctomycetota bacterium]
MSFAELFPELTVNIRPGSFAHDRGMSYKIDSITVAGESCKQTEILQSIVRLRNGWGKQGEKDNNTVQAVALAFVLGFAKEIRKSWIETESAQFSRSPAGLDYHKPRATIVDLEDGVLAVVVSGFRRGYTGNHGTNYHYEVEAFNTATGVAIPVELAKDPEESPALTRSPAEPEKVKLSPIPPRRNFVS